MVLHVSRLFLPAREKKMWGRLQSVMVEQSVRVISYEGWGFGLHTVVRDKIDNLRVYLFVCRAFFIQN